MEASNQSRQLWEKASEIIRDDLSETSFKTYIEPLRPLSLAGGQLSLLVPDAEMRQTLNTRYRTFIHEALCAAAQSEVAPLYLLPSEAKEREQKPNPLAPLNPRATFDSYVVGKSNQLAYAAAIGAANSPGSQYNPLFLYSQTEIGRAHV